MRGLLITVVVLLLIMGTYLYLESQPGMAPSQNLPPANPSSLDTKPGAIGATQIPSDNAGQTNTLREEAREYVAEITKHSDDPIEVESADDFVSRDEPISLLGDRQYETRTLNELSEEMSPDAPLTIVREQEQVEVTTVKNLLAQSGGDLSKPVKVLQGGDVKQSTVGEILDQHEDPDAPISIIKKTEHLEVTTVQELMNNENLAGDTSLKVIREPYRLQTTTVGELLMGEKTVTENSIFYVRNITESDNQGLWGIVHDGLVRNFASGIALQRGKEVRNYQVEIPTDADERLADQSSSFLGRMVDRKTHESYVYNYEHGSMGKSPDIIHAGQEIVIIGFTPEELYKIYEHFVTRSESRS